MAGFFAFLGFFLSPPFEVTPKRYDLRLEVRTLGVDDSFDGSLKAELDLLNLGCWLRFLCQEVLIF